MTEHSAENPRILGSLHASDGQGLVRIEDTVATPPDQVWAALTDWRRLADWLGEVDGELRLGGDYHGFWRVSGWDGTGHVVTCEPSRRLVLTTRETGEQREHRTEITIARSGPGSRIVIEQQGMPLEHVAAYGAGMQVHVEDLEAHLTGRAERHTAERWGALFPGYRALPVED